MGEDGIPTINFGSPPSGGIPDVVYDENGIPDIPLSNIKVTKEEIHDEL